MTLMTLLDHLFPTVHKINPEMAVRRAEMGDLTLIDIREAHEVRRSGGKARGAVHVPTLMLRHVAYPKSPAFNPALNPERAVAVYGETGSDIEFAVRSLIKMGYREVYSLGTLAAWVGAGGPCEG